MEKNRQTVIWFWLILAAAAAVRATTFDFSPYSLREDGSMVGLAALHWYHGTDFPLISYGQAYLGTLEAIVAAGLFFLLGPGIPGLTLAPYIFSLAFVAVSYFLGKEIGGRRMGLLTMAFAAFCSPYLATWSTAIKGGYPETLFFGTLLLWLTLRWRGGRHPVWLGVVAGLAWWCHPLSIFYLSAVGIYLLFTSPKRLPLFALGFFLGSLPFWIYNFQNHFLSFTGGGGFRPEKIHQGLKNFFLQASPSMFSWKGIGLLAVPFYALSLLFLWKRPLFLLFFLTTAFFYSLNKFGVQGETRYVMFLFSLFPVSLAWLSEQFAKKIPAGWTIPLLIVGGANLHFVLQDIPRRTHIHTVENSYYKEMFGWFEETGLNRISSYKGPIISVVSEEKIVGAEPRTGRFHDHAVEVDAAGRIGILRWKFMNPDLASSIAGAGFSFDSKSNPMFDFYYNFRLPAEKLVELSPAAWRGSSAWVPGTAVSAYDRNLGWCWTAGEVKEEGQSYVLDLGRAEPVRLVRIYNGQEFLSFPAAYRLDTSEDGKTWRTAVEVNPFSFVYAAGDHPIWNNFHSRLEARLDGKPIRALRLTHVGKSDVYTWRMNEIYLYRAEKPAAFPADSDFNALLKRLRERNVAFVYADRPLSARIDLKSKGKIGALRSFNEKYPYAPNTSRRIDFSRRWAVVFENQTSPSSEEALKNAGVAFEKEMIGPYMVWFGAPAQTKTPLDWTGFSIVKNAFESPSPALQGTPSLSKPPVVFEEAIELLECLPLSPQVKAGKSFQIRYAWRTLKPFDKNWATFVHFKNGDWIFQNDHAFYYGDFPPNHWKTGETVTETYTVKVPEDFPAGETEIWVGIKKFNEKEGRARISSSSVPTKSRRARVGTLQVSSSAR